MNGKDKSSLVPLALGMLFLCRSVAAQSDGSPSSDWQSQAQDEIAAFEYHVTWQEQTALSGLHGAWQAPNRIHNLRTYFTDTGIRVVPREESKPSWEWGLALFRYGRSGHETAVAGAVVSPSGNRIDYNRHGIVEWYVNDPRGLEQGFTLSSPPPFLEGEDAESGTHEVHIDLSLTGTLDPSFSADGQAIDFKGRNGAVLRYSQLRVEDARGRELPARMEAFAELGVRGVRLVFDDDDATYPVTVDPLMTSPAWTAEINQTNALFARAVATAGDVNGDGYSDVIVGAPHYDNGQTNEGAAFVYHGSATGLAASPAWTGEGGLSKGTYGSAVATAGDVNGDGYSDVIVGQGLPGRAFLYHGSAAGLAASPAWTAQSNQANTSFAWAVATAGDVNGDGYSDVIVGANLNDDGQSEAAFVYLGSASGLNASPSWTGPGAQGRTAVATAGDVNGDGYSDVIVGSGAYNNGQANEGRASVYHGSASGLSTSAAWTIEGDQTNAGYGRSVATAGDVNGDGYSDVIVGQEFPGRAFVYHGSASGLATSPGWTAEGGQTFDYFGHSVATAGDTNGDGYADVIVGAPTYSNGTEEEGAAFVYQGSATGLSGSPVWTSEGGGQDAKFGFSVGTAGDVNGDGYADIIVSANQWLYGGRAFVYHGSAAALAPSPAWTGVSGQLDDEFGASVATAGDVNGDGYSDVIVGAPYYDNDQSNEGRAFVYHGSAAGPASTPGWTAESDQAGSRFGFSVGTAGDVNGDGYSDVIVGAFHYDNGQAQEVGHAFVYHGSATGLALSPAWTAESAEAFAEFGRSVATAGDVNGDGYSDVIVGASGNDGRAYVYHGSAVGLATSPAWIAQGDPYAGFGYSVATAGDVNGDGYSDVIVGADENEEAYVYHGSPVGLAMNPAWTAESDQPGSRFGLSVATAGDVDGDGYADVMVGAPYYANGEIDEGRTFVYHGSGEGLALGPAWTAESDQAQARLGLSVATAGDVNGDGYADVIVGAPLHNNGESVEGRAFVYHGSAAGLAPSPAWTAEGDHSYAAFGRSVATAGDVNGDGYADVIVSNRWFDDPREDEGRPVVHCGNGGLGSSLRPQQRRSTDVAPIAQLGASDSADSFRLALLGRTPFGRGRVKLEWEVKPLGASFNGLGTGLSSAVTDTGVAGALLSELQTVLLTGTPYHWRVRLRYDSVTTPFQQHSRWLTVPWSGWNEKDVSTAGLAAGRVPDGAPSTPLRVTRAGGDISLSWSDSCLATDTDYAIYEGTLGSFTSHESRFCTTAGETEKTFMPLAGNKYYLVVPRNAGREGSYGMTSSLAERPQGLAACLPQQIGICP